MSKSLKQTIKVAIKKSFSYEIKNITLFISAFTHKYKSSNINYERLEILGDAVIQLCITELLFKKYPSYSEGNITVMRQNLVNTQNLNIIIAKLDLIDLIRSINSHYKGVKISSDIFESIIGAIFLDSDYSVVKKIIHTIFKSSLSEKLLVKDFKTQLQEYLHQKKLSLPVYLTKKLSKKSFIYEVTCKIPKTRIHETMLSNKVKPAQQQLAKIILKSINEKN